MTSKSRPGAKESSSCVVAITSMPRCSLNAAQAAGWISAAVTRSRPSSAAMKRVTRPNPAPKSSSLPASSSEPNRQRATALTVRQISRPETRYIRAARSRLRPCS